MGKRRMVGECRKPATSAPLINLAGLAVPHHIAGHGPSPRVSELSMAVYHDLAKLAGKALAQADAYYAEATTFPERLRTVLRDFLQAPDHMLVSRKMDDDGLTEPAWDWPLLTEPFSGRDMGQDCSFTFAISITFDLVAAGHPSGSTIVLTPAFRFKPIGGGGFEVFVLERDRDGELISSDRFEIQGDEGWAALLERCVRRSREMMEFDPYSPPAEQPRRFGFDLLRPAQ